MNYNPLKNEENPENQQKKEIYRFILLIFYFTKGDLLQGILFYFIFACSFAGNTSTPASYGGSKCVTLLAWGRAASFYLTMGFIMFCFVNPILACTMSSLKNALTSIPDWVFQNLLRYNRIFMYVWGGIIFLGLMISLGYDEKCKGLTSLTGFFVFVVIVALIIIGLCYCFVLSDAGYQTIDKAKHEVQNYGTMKEEKHVEQKKEGEVKLETQEGKNQSKAEVKPQEDGKPVEGISQPK